MIELSSRSYAKVNLFLYVTDKRLDGYHNIYTLFLPISIYDTITITRSAKLSLRSNRSELELLGEDNIIIKTDRILRRDYGLTYNYDIELIKTIPIGAGLGGGSSNAATYLKLVNEAASLNLSVQSMESIMLELGSDTVYFLDPQPKLAYGRGELLSSINLNIKLYLLIINPNIEISTRSIYSSDMLLLTDLQSIYIINENEVLDSFDNILNLMHNDLEPVVVATYKEISDLIDSLNSYDNHSKAIMTGSGSTVFSVYDSETKRDSALNYIKDIYPNYYIQSATVI